MATPEENLRAKIPGTDTGITKRNSVCDICAPGPHCGITGYVKDGKLIKAGNSTEVLDNPIHALKWLVAALEKRGRQLKAGQVVSSGTFFVPPHLERGEYVARYTGTITEDVKLTVK